jgi:hypothetical protein
MSRNSPDLTASFGRFSRPQFQRRHATPNMDTMARETSFRAQFRIEGDQDTAQAACPRVRVTRTSNKRVTKRRRRRDKQCSDPSTFRHAASKATVLTKQKRTRFSFARLPLKFSSRRSVVALANAISPPFSSPARLPDCFTASLVSIASTFAPFLFSPPVPSFLSPPLCRSPRSSRSIDQDGPPFHPV